MKVRMISNASALKADKNFTSAWRHIIFRMVPVLPCHRRDVESFRDGKKHGATTMYRQHHGEIR